MADLLAPAPAVRIYTGMTVRLEAIDPTTGAAVAGVTVNNVAVYGRALEDDTIDRTELAVWLQPHDV